MLNPGTVILFIPVVLTSVYLSYLAYKHEILLRVKIIELQAFLVNRDEKSQHSLYTASQVWFMKDMAEGSEMRFKEAVRKLYFTRFGGILILALITLSGWLGLIIGLGLAFFNSQTALQVGVIPIIVIITYILLVFLSEVIQTIMFTKNMRGIGNAKLGPKDLKVFKRAVYILAVRKRQFLVIALLLILYGVLGGVFDLLVVYLFTLVQVFFITVLGDPGLMQHIVILVIIAIITSVLFVSALAVLYKKFCLFLIRLPDIADQMKDWEEPPVETGIVKKEEEEEKDGKFTVEVDTSPLNKLFSPRLIYIMN